MRRRDRQVADMEEIRGILSRCDVCRLALYDEDGPYILPLNFGFTLEDGTLTLYFHGAKEGKKHERMARDPRVGFELDCGHQLVLPAGEERCTATMCYESVIGKGVAEPVPEEEKERALNIILGQYGIGPGPFDPKYLPATAVFRVISRDFTAKRR